jgi:hypothetical protein
MRKREEEMAKRVKLLKKVDEDTIRAINDWQQQHNQVFFYQGMRYFDRMAAQQRQYDAYKQMLRNFSKERRKVRVVARVVRCWRQPLIVVRNGMGRRTRRPPLRPAGRRHTRRRA